MPSPRAERCRWCRGVGEGSSLFVSRLGGHAEVVTVGRMIKGWCAIALGLLILGLNVNEIRRGYIIDGKFRRRRYSRTGNALDFWFHIIGMLIVAAGVITYGIHLL